MSLQTPLGQISARGRGFPPAVHSHRHIIAYSARPCAKNTQNRRQPPQNASAPLVLTTSARTGYNG